MDLLVYYHFNSLSAKGDYILLNLFYYHAKSQLFVMKWVYKQHDF